MGLFSFLRKNKQEASGKDSGFYSADEQAALRARSKRASHAGASAAARKDANDPILPEKKRARRRLVGAIALALAVAVGLPMVLDSEPKPLASDIAILIPSKDKPAAANEPERADPAAGLEPSEEEVALPPPAAPKLPTALAPLPAPALVEAPPRAEPRAEPPARLDAVPKAEPRAAAEPRHEPRLPESKPLEAKHEPKPVEAKHEPKPLEAKHEAKPAEPKPAELAKHEPKPLEVKREAKPAEPKPAVKSAPRSEEGGDAVRALAILEGKGAGVEPAPSRYVIQVAALANQDKIDELQAKLREAGIKFYAQKVPTHSGERTRIRVGPFGSREEAEKMRAKLGRIGLSGALVPA